MDNSLSLDFIGDTLQLISISALIFYSAFRWVRKLSQDALTRAEVVVAAILLAVCQITVSQIILGLLGFLTWFPVALFNIFISSSLIALERWMPTATSYRKPEDDSRSDTWPIGWLILPLVAAIMFVILSVAIHKAPTGFDSLWYHLPMAVEWMQLEHLPLRSTIQFSYYPGTSELLDLWLLLPFQDTNFVNLQNWFGTLLTALTLYAIARSLGVSRRLSWFAPLLFLSARTILLTLAYFNTQDNDLFVAAFFLAGACFIVPGLRSGNKALFIFEGIAIGLLVGTKYLGLQYAGLLIITHIVVQMYMGKGRQLVSNLLLVATFSVIAGGFWYLRNIFAYGTPITPIGIKILGLTLFPGTDKVFGQSYAETILLSSLGTPEILRMIFENGIINWGGAMGVLTLLALPTITGIIIFRVFINRQSLKPEHLMFLILIWSSFLGVFITPLVANHVSLRGGYPAIKYTLPFWSLGSLAAVWLADMMQDKWSLPANIILIVATLHGYIRILFLYPQDNIAALSRPTTIFLGVGLLLSLPVIFVASKGSLKFRLKRIYYLGLAILVIFGSTMILAAHRGGQQARIEEYAATIPGQDFVMQALEQMAVTRVNVIGGPYWAIFPFQGKNLDMRVYPCHTDVFGWLNEPEDWIACIQTHNVEAVIFMTSPEAKSKISQNTILENYPDHFLLINTFESIQVYKVVQGT